MVVPCTDLYRHSFHIITPPADALVQLAQLSILDTESIAGNNPLNSGRSPLSANLVSHGESLVLER